MNKELFNRLDFVINTHKNFSEESFYSKFAKDIPDFKYKGV